MNIVKIFCEDIVRPVGSRETHQVSRDLVPRDLVTSLMKRHDNGLTCLIGSVCSFLIVCVCRVATLDRSGILRSRLSVWRMLFWTTNWHYRCVSWWPSRGTGWSSLRGERSTLNSWGSFTIRYNQLTSSSRNQDDSDPCSPQLCHCSF